MTKNSVDPAGTCALPWSPYPSDGGTMTPICEPDLLPDDRVGEARDDLAVLAGYDERGRATRPPSSSRRRFPHSRARPCSAPRPCRRLRRPRRCPASGPRSAVVFGGIVRGTVMPGRPSGASTTAGKPSRVRRGAPSARAGNARCTSITDTRLSPGAISRLVARTAEAVLGRHDDGDPRALARARQRLRRGRRRSRPSLRPRVRRVVVAEAGGL